MTETAYWYSSLEVPLDAVAIAEAKIIVDAFAEREPPIEIGGFPDDANEDADLHSGGIAYMYADNQILAREQYLRTSGGPPERPKQPEPPESVERPEQSPSQSPEQSESPESPVVRGARGILEILAGEQAQVLRITRVIGDIVLLHLSPVKGTKTRDDEKPEGEEPPLLRLLDAIDRELGPGIATPNHILTAAQIVHPCSATEPQEVYPSAKPDPARCRDGGARVRIFQADTGLLPDAGQAFPWLDGVEGEDDPRAGTAPGSTILPYGGHGTFVAGVLRCMAPHTQVHVANIFNIAGSATESEAVQGLNRAFGFGPEIIHITASCLTRNNIPPLAFEKWLKQLRAYKHVLCVAEAGNNYTRRPAWPGAFPDVLSVGALAANWRRRADFSNYGAWVDVYAPGENLVNAFGSGTYKCQVPPNVNQVRTFSGLAQWSGTSFSAPIVTGLIAARMTRCGESPREAADALLAKARAQAIPGLGPVLFPGCAGDEDCGRSGRCGRCGCCGCCGCCGDSDGGRGRGPASRRECGCRDR